jgi:hypothetical protein
MQPVTTLRWPDRQGGPGSGNHWRYGAKSTTGDYRTLDVRRWAREGVLRPGYWGGWKWTRAGKTVASIQMRAEQDRVILIYRHRSGDAEWKDEQYPVRIVRTPCNLGGSRAWFICPAVGCGRRVAILYGGSIFACRRCYRLAYASSREDTGNRAQDAARLPLGVERIELLLESLIGRLSGEDRTTEGEPGSGLISPSHGSLSRLM